MPRPYIRSCSPSPPRRPSERRFHLVKSSGMALRRPVRLLQGQFATRISRNPCRISRPGHTFPCTHNPGSITASVLPAYERQGWREAPSGEMRVGISSLEFLGRRAVGRNEPGETLIEIMAHGLARRVKERGRRFLQPLGTAFGVLREDGRGTEGLDACPPPCRGGVLLDLLAPACYPLPVGFRSEMLPAASRGGERGSPSRSWCTGEGRDSLLAGDGRRTLASGRTGAGQGFSGQDRPGAVESWPLQKLGDKEAL